VCEPLGDSPRVKGLDQGQHYHLYSAYKNSKVNMGDSSEGQTRSGDKEAKVRRRALQICLSVGCHAAVPTHLMSQAWGLLFGASVPQARDDKEVSTSSITRFLVVSFLVHVCLPCRTRIA
jgi:hypothetical protein